MKHFTNLKVLFCDISNPRYSIPDPLREHKIFQVKPESKFSHVLEAHEREEEKFKSEKR